MKKALTILIALLLLASFAGCGAPASQPEAPPAPAPIGVEWRPFIAEYEAWVDDYAALLERYGANPADAALMSEYANMTREMDEWSERAAGMELDLADDPEALREYLEALAKITQKLIQKSADTLNTAPATTEPALKESAAPAPAEGEKAAPASADWEQFLADYEAWADAYILFMKKYNANPADMTLLADYSAKALEMVEWAKKAEELEKDLETDPAALKSYLETLTRISEKLLKAGN